MTVIPVVSLDEPNLRPYRTLRRPMEHQQNGIFVAEGEKVVRRLLASSFDVLTLLLTPEWLDSLRPVLESRPGDTQVFVAGKPVVESIVGFHLHQGIMAVARIPRSLTLEEALRHSHPPMLLAAVDGLTNAENLGVLVRNCAAFDVHALLVGETSSSPYLRRSVRNSMGTVFTLPIVHLENIVDALRELRNQFGVRVIAAHPHAEQISLPQAAMNGNCCVVFGSEGDGVSGRVLAECDDLVAIPMREGVDSLNVASASAVFLYEARAQRGNLRLGNNRRQDARNDL
ncbi:MAG TPA: RNA methyltransferase [Bacteroidota bacterium]|nr:RNA methyltransferase [Bacteroidota bacterium]